MTNLVVGTDGSNLAIAAATAGVSLMGHADRLMIVSVADTVDPSLAADAPGHAGSTMTQDEVEEHYRDAQSRSEYAVEATREALENLELVSSGRVETHVIEGEPGPSLCDFAADVNATAVIVGSHGRGGIWRALLGSTSDYVVRHAPCTVVITRSPRLEMDS
jgi:nucleotide-binding universal stress UspA family protein